MSDLDEAIRAAAQAFAVYEQRSTELARVSAAADQAGQAFREAKDHVDRLIHHAIRPAESVEYVGLWVRKETT